MYDFILFENYYLAINHYKDLCIIAKLLKESGYSVAIANVFEEGKYCSVEGIPHISFKKKSPIYRIHPGRTLYQKLINLFIPIRIAYYLRFVLKQLNGKYKNLYVGSYYTGMSTLWIREIPKTSHAFFWGLRSSRLIEYKYGLLSKNSISSYILYRYFKNHRNLCFFVSDEIIYKEFIEIGIERERIIIRPERMIKELPYINSKKPINYLNILSIGSIRPTKQIEKVLDSLKLINDKNIFYTIAGKTDDKYELVIQKHTQGLINVKRLNYRIPENEYSKLIQCCDFLILCDQKQLSSVTNGTMNEALLMNKPIIAPNFNPYKYYIEKYSIGILYNEDSLDDLANAIKIAKKIGPRIFYRNIKEYQKSLLYDNVKVFFSENIKNILEQ